jgi:hypothetical protein
LFLELGRKELQRCDEHRRLGGEVESDDAGGHFREGSYFFDRRPRRPVNVQGGNACIDQTLALAAVGAAHARSTGRFVGFFLGATHAGA